MRGFLTRTPDGGISATLRDEWGYGYELTGTPAEVDGRKGYAVECCLVRIPAWLSVPGDEEWFEVGE